MPYTPKILQELEDEIVELKDKIQSLEAENEQLWRFAKAHDELEKAECNFAELSEEEYNNLVYELRKARIALEDK